MKTTRYKYHVSEALFCIYLHQERTLKAKYMKAKDVQVPKKGRRV